MTFLIFKNDFLIVDFYTQFHLAIFYPVVKIQTVIFASLHQKVNFLFNIIIVYSAVVCNAQLLTQN